MRAILLASALLALAATAAFADEPARRAVIVLDRGEAAKESARIDADNALRIWRALEARGLDAALVACGVDGQGATMVGAVTPSRAGLAALAKSPSLAFAGPTDPRQALLYALEGDGPVDVILLGPFGPAPAGKEKDDAAGPTALTRWNDDAPEGSRIVAVRTATGVLGRLEGARGLAAEGLLVVGFDPPEVDAGRFSALGAEDDARMEARVKVLADVLPLGGDDAPGAVLTASSDVGEDRVEASDTAGLHTFVLKRRPRDGRTATISFQRRAGVRATWLCEPPQPLTFRWEALLPEALLQGPDGKPAKAFAAIDVAAGEPRSLTYRLRRARTGPAPAWRVAAAEGELPAGLSVEVGRELEVSPEIGESPVVVTYAAQAGVPVTASGTIVLSAEGVPEAVRLPFQIRVQPGRARLEVEVHPAAMPRAEKDELSVLRLVAVNGNVPPSLQLRATCDGGQQTWLRAVLLDAAGGQSPWRLDQPLVLDVGVERRLAFELAEGAPAGLPWPCQVSLHVEAPPGVEVEGEAVIPVRRRLPQLVLGGPVPTFRVKDGALTADAPILLQVDADGGDGEWLAGLLTTPPMLRSPGDAPVGWQAVTRGRGVWHIVPTGEWTGKAPSIFTPSEQEVEVQVRWEPGGTPGSLHVPVEIPPRWGVRGFVILVLAFLALVLALLVVGYMRTPAVTGTLLYTVDGVGGTVGRLDLAPVGRRAKPVTADASGRLSVAGAGDAIARVRPTRVGGMLEYVDPLGHKERRLLVDGVSLRIGRHLVRFVSGRAMAAHEAQVAAADSEDLLGPEYDLESGRIDAMGPDATDPT